MHELGLVPADPFEGQMGADGIRRRTSTARAARGFEEFEATVASCEEVVEFRRTYGRPDYLIRVGVADHAAYEAFLTGKLSGLPAVPRLTSHLTRKRIKADS